MALRVQHRVIQLEALALIVIVREAKERDCVIDVDGELRQERETGRGE